MVYGKLLFSFRFELKSENCASIRRCYSFVLLSNSLLYILFDIAPALLILHSLTFFSLLHPTPFLLLTLLINTHLTTGFALFLFTSYSKDDRDTVIWRGSVSEPCSLTTRLCI